jgi:hypothetical protein
MRKAIGKVRNDRFAAKVADLQPGISLPWGKVIPADLLGDAGTGE